MLKDISPYARRFSLSPSNVFSPSAWIRKSKRGKCPKGSHVSKGYQRVSGLKAVARKACVRHCHAWSPKRYRVRGGMCAESKRSKEERAESKKAIRKLSEYQKFLRVVRNRVKNSLHMAKLNWNINQEITRRGAPLWRAAKARIGPKVSAVKAFAYRPTQTGLEALVRAVARM